MTPFFSPIQIGTVDLSSIGYAQCPVLLSRYIVGEQYAVEIGANPDDDDPAPIARLTVNLVDASPHSVPAGTIAVKTWAENAPIVEALRKSPLFKPTDRTLELPPHRVVVEFWKIDPEAPGLPDDLK